MAYNGTRNRINNATTMIVVKMVEIKVPTMVPIIIPTFTMAQIFAPSTPHPR